MGYNATYGLQKSDSMMEFPIGEEKDGQQNFLCQDELGQLKVRTELAVCDICNEPLNGIAYYHASYAYCEKCEQKHRENEKKAKLKNRINRKITEISNKQKTKKAVKK